MLHFEYKPSYDVNDFRRIVKALRSPGGCPWDIEQTHASIRRGLLEEAYEVCEAIDEGNPTHLREELGDLLMQVIFHSQIEEEAGRFDLNDVADAACKKLILRHPHVFGSLEVSGSEEVLSNWEDIKRAEKAQSTTADAMEGVAKSLPAMWRAEKVQKKARKDGFDWPDIKGAMDKLREELAELQETIDAGNIENAREELGDLLFSAVNVARFLETDPEIALGGSTDKFILRYRLMQDEAALAGKELKGMQLNDMEELYQLCKSRERD